ncbi:MAG: HEAT repeat domain-containing protein [Candidatus Brocadiia bacterium]
MRARVATALLGMGIAFAAAVYGGEGPTQEQLREEAALFKRVATYEFGQNAGDLNRVNDLLLEAHGDRAARKRLTERLAALLRSPEATYAAKQFACRQLMREGTAEAVSALASLLGDEEKLAHMARYALERMPYPQAGEALRDALEATEGRVLLGVVGSVGARRDAQAVPRLVALAKGADGDLAEATIEALGRIGGQQAADALAAMVKTAGRELRPTVVDSYLRCADHFLDAGQKAKALGIYQALYEPSEESHVRAAALRGRVACGEKKAMDVVVQALVGNDAAMQGAALGLVRDIPGEAATRAFASQLPKLGTEGKVLLLNALADRGDSAARDVVLGAARSGESEVRAAALKALADLGDASTVPLLAAAAASDDPKVAGAAKATLRMLGGEDVDQAILEAMRGAEPKVRVALIETLTARRAQDAVPRLLECLRDPNEAVREAAFKAVGTLAGAKALPSLVEFLLDAKGPGERRAAERAVATVAGRVEDEEKRIAPILGALGEARGEAKASLLEILSRFGGAEAQAAVEKALADPQVREAAIRALADWPDAGPADTLLEIVRDAKSEKERILALRGFVEVFALAGDLPAAKVLDGYQEAMRLATRPAEKKLVLSAMANVRHPDAIKALQPYLEDDALKAEAQAAIQKVEAAMKAPAKVTASHNPQKAKAAIDGDPGTRWDTGKAQSGGEWFLIELPVEQKIAGLMLDTRKSAGDYPRQYEVYVSRDGKSWGAPVAKGQGKKPVVTIAIEPTYGRFIKIVQKGSTRGLFWSIHELQVRTQ